MSEIHRQAELRHMLEETEKFVTEAHKLEAERRKLQAEHDQMTALTIKSYAETAKLDKERWWFPWLQLLTVVISSAAIGAIVARLIH
jgi:hypothetical protein